MIQAENCAKNTIFKATHTKFYYWREVWHGAPLLYFSYYSEFEDWRGRSQVVVWLSTQHTEVLTDLSVHLHVTSTKERRRDAESVCWGGQGQADSALDMEPNAGLYVMTLRSWSELKLRVRCLATWATQLPLDFFFPHSPSYPFLSSLSVLVYSGCHIKIPWPGWLKQ